MSIKKKTEIQNENTEGIEKIENRIELVIPKKMSVKMSTPLITICVLLITIAVVGTFIAMGYGGYYIYNNGLDFINDKVDLSQYDAMVQNYETVIDSYEAKITSYESTLDGYEKLIEDYISVLDDYEAAIDVQNTSLDTLITELSEIKDSLSVNMVSIGSTPEFDDSAFVIYYLDSYQDELDSVLEICGLEDDENIVLVSFSYEDMDVDEVIENADLVLYETDEFEFEDEDLLSSTALGIYYYDLFNVYPMGTAIGGNQQGVINEFAYTLCPGYIQLRADLAEKYFGTTDATEIYKEYFCDVETMADTCEDIYKDSDGDVVLFGSVEDVERMFAGALSEPDIDYDEFCDLTEKYLPDVSMWSEEWFESIYAGNDVEAMAVVGTTWMTKYLLTDTAFDHNNTILVKAPIDFVWGGETAAVTGNCSDVMMASTIVKAMLTQNAFLDVLNDDGSVVNNRTYVNGANFEYDIDDMIYDNQDYILFIKNLLELK